jgi:hypothetical protein
MAADGSDSGAWKATKQTHRPWVARGETLRRRNHETKPSGQNLDVTTLKKTSYDGKLRSIVDEVGPANVDQQFGLNEGGMHPRHHIEQKSRRCGFRSSGRSSGNLRDE